MDLRQIQELSGDPNIATFGETASYVDPNLKKAMDFKQIQELSAANQAAAADQQIFKALSDADPSLAQNVGEWGRN